MNFGQSGLINEPNESSKQTGYSLALPRLKNVQHILAISKRDTLNEPFLIFYRLAASGMEVSDCSGLQHLIYCNYCVLCKNIYLRQVEMSTPANLA